MFKKETISSAAQAAYPIILGYIAIGLPCGILNVSIGLNPLQILAMSLLFYSGAGQFMIPNMYLAGNPLASIILSVSMVNTRQMLYSASLSQFCQTCKKRLSFLFSATVTDESFGVNIAKFNGGDWTVQQATWVNLLSLSSWALSNFVGALIGNVIEVPLAIASFAMTSIFICLATTQKMTRENVTAIVFAVLGVILFKVVGLGNFAILGGAIIGVLAACVARKVLGATNTDNIDFLMAEQGAVSDKAVFSARDDAEDGR